MPSFYSIGNPDITWETNTNMNIGLEFNLFRNRLNGEVNFYNRKTTNLLNWMSIPESYGARGYYGNMGDIRNRGWEIILSGDIIRTKHVVWSGSFNIAFNSTKILSLPETKTANYGGYSETNDDDMRNWYTVGGPLYNAMLPEYAGVNDQGEALYWIDDDLYQKYAVKGSQTAQSQPVPSTHAPPPTGARLPITLRAPHCLRPTAASRRPSARMASMPPSPSTISLAARSMTIRMPTSWKMFHRRATATPIIRIS